MRQAPPPAPRKRGASHAFRNHILRIAATRGFAEANSELYRHQQAAKEAANLALNRRSPRAEKSRHPLHHGSSDPGTGWTPEQLRAAGIAFGHPGLLGRTLRQGATDIVDQTLGAPAAAVAVAKAVGQDLAPPRFTGKGADWNKKPLAHTRALAGAVADQTVADLRHPLRHPGFTALDVLAALSAGAGTASRVAGASRALREGEGVRAAMTRPGHQGGSLLHKRAPGETELAPGVFRLEPDNPLLRPLHHLRTRALQRKLAHPDTTEARTMLGRALQATTGPENAIGRENRANVRVQTDLDRAAAATAERSERKLSLPQRTATRLVAIEGHHALEHPEEVVARHAATHRAWADEGIHPRTNRTVARDIEAALPVLKDPDFHPYVEGVRRLSLGGEETAIKRGQLTPEQAEARKANMARVYRGGRYEVTPARRARAAHVREYPGKLVTEQYLGGKGEQVSVERPRTRAEAERRVAEIDAANEQIAARLAGHTLPKGEQLRRNRINGLISAFERDGTRRRGTAKALRAGRQPLVSEDALAYGQKQLDELVASRPEHPVVKAYLQRVDEGNRLRELLNAPEDPFALAAGVEPHWHRAVTTPGSHVIFEPGAKGTGGARGGRVVQGASDPMSAHRAGHVLVEYESAGGPVRRWYSAKELAPDLGTVTSTLTRPGKPVILQRTVLKPGHRVHMKAVEARRRSGRFEGGLGPEGLDAPPGSFYFPAGERFKLMGRSQVPRGAYSPRPSAYGLAPPAQNRGMLGTLGRFTGRGVRHGVVEKPAQAIAHRYVAQHRLYSAQDIVEHARKLGSETRKSELQVAVRDGRTISPELRQEIDAQLERAGGGDENALGRAAQLLRTAMQDEHATSTTPLGARIEGVTWVDRRTLKPLVADPQNQLLRAIAKANAPFRLFGVYLRPAYFFTNYPQNVGLAAIKQGFRVVPNMVRARRARRLYGHELTDWIESGMGTARSQSYLPRGPVSATERGVTSFMTHITDRDMRVAAFLYRAAERGYKPTRSDLQRLRDDTSPKAERDRLTVFRRARRDAVDFDSMTPAERELVDVVFFFPWMTRSSAWAVRAALNRPMKTAGLAQLSQTPQARELMIQHAPSWLKGYLVTRYGLVNPHPAGPFSTQGEILRDLPQAATALLHGKTIPGQSSFATEFGTPVVEALAGVNPLGQTAPAYILKRLGVHSGVLGKPSKTFPRTGPMEAAGPFVLGGLYPRQPDRSFVATQAAREEPRAQKLADVRTQQTAHLRNLVRKGLLPRAQVKEYRLALDLYNERNELNSQIEKAVPNDHPRTREIRKLLGLIALLEQHGLMSPEKAKEYRHAYHSSTERTVKELRSDRNAFWEETVGPMLTWYREKSGAND